MTFRLTPNGGVVRLTKRNYRECDVCEERIGNGMHLRIRRFLLHGWIVRLCKYRRSAGSHWRKEQVDLCADCWQETKREIRERVG